MSKKSKKEFVSSKLNQHFKLDQQTKRMMALSDWSPNVKLSVKEQADQDVKLTPLTRNEFKKMMMKGQLSEVDAKLTGMNDPFWKPKKEEPEVVTADGVAGTTPSRKGKKQPRMRKPEVAVGETNAN